MPKDALYEDGEDALKRILTLVDLCPQDLRIAAFEGLLRGYVQGGRTSPKEKAAPAPAPANPAPPTLLAPEWAAGVPPEVLTRLKALAKRNQVSEEAVADLFDFSVDPFTFGTLHIEGPNNADRARKSALLVGSRAFLATGQWVADWAEVKAMATNQNCYDGVNFATSLRGGDGSIFKKIEVGKTIVLADPGKKQAERLIAELVGGASATQQ